MEYSTNPRPDPRPRPPTSTTTRPPTPSRSWRSSLEFGELVRGIREQRLLQPIVLHEGRILDGRNRNRACQHAAGQ